MLSLKKTKAYLLQSCRVLLLITHQGSFLTTVSMRLTFQTSDSSNHSTGSIRITSIVNYIPWFWHKGYKRSAIDSTTISVYKCWDCPGMRWQLIDISHTKMNAVTKSPMSMTFPATLSAVKVAKQQNTKETAWVRTRGEGSLRMERAWNRRRCEKRKCFGMNWWRAENEKNTREGRTHTNIILHSCLLVCLCPPGLDPPGSRWFLAVHSHHGPHWALLTLSTKLFVEVWEWKDCSLFPLFHHVSSWLL